MRGGDLVEGVGGSRTVSIHDKKAEREEEERPLEAKSISCWLAGEVT